MLTYVLCADCGILESESPFLFFHLQRNFPVYRCNCLTLAPSIEIFPVTSLMRCVPSNALCKMSSPQYPEMTPFVLTLALSLSLSPAWHCVPSQLLLWSIHARSKGLGKSHLHIKIDLETYLPLVWLMDTMTFSVSCWKASSGSSPSLLYSSLAQNHSATLLVLRSNCL